MFVLPANTQGGSPVRELRSPGSVRGVLGNWYSYRDIDGQFMFVNSLIQVDESMLDPLTEPDKLLVKILELVQVEQTAGTDIWKGWLRE